MVAFETVHHRKDGTTFPVEVRVRPFWEGGRLYAVSHVRDMTERNRTEQALTCFARCSTAPTTPSRWWIRKAVGSST